MTFRMVPQHLKDFGDQTFMSTTTKLTKAKHSSIKLVSATANLSAAKFVKDNLDTDVDAFAG